MLRCFLVSAGSSPQGKNVDVFKSTGVEKRTSQKNTSWTVSIQVYFTLILVRKTLSEP